MSLLGISLLLLYRWNISGQLFVETGPGTALLANYSLSLTAFLLIRRQVKMGEGKTAAWIQLMIPLFAATFGTVNVLFTKEPFWMRWAVLAALFSFAHGWFLSIGAYGSIAVLWNRERSWCLGAISFCILFLALMVIYLPGGLLLGDSQQMLLQALGMQNLKTWHPPFVTSLWRLTMLSGSAATLYMLKAAVYMMAAVIIAYALADRLRWRIAILTALLFFPPLMLGVTLAPKDSEMFVFTALSEAFLTLFVFRTPRTRYLYFSLLASTLAIYSRYNAASQCLFFIAPAIAFWWIQHHPVQTARKAVLIGTPLFILFMIIPYCAFFGNSQFFRQDQVFLEAMAKWDLSGISFLSNSKEVIPEKLINEPYRAMNDTDFIYSLYYLPHVNLPTWWHRDLKTGDRVEGPVLRTPSYSEWFRIVTTYPKAYLKHRWEIGKLLMVMGQDFPTRINAKWRSWEKRLGLSPLPAPFAGTVAYRALSAWIDYGSLLPHLVYFILSASLCLTGLLLLHWQVFPVEKSSLTLIYYFSLSGICLTVPLIFLAAPYYRYLVPQIFSSILALIITIRFFARRYYLHVEDLT